MIDISTASMSQHIVKPAPLFAEYGHLITPTGSKIKKVKQLYASRAPRRQDSTTREVTT